MRLAPCPQCGNSDLEEEATGALEIRGTCYQSCWIECKRCGFEGPTVEVHDGCAGESPVTYEKVRAEWNEMVWGPDWMNVLRDAEY